MAINVATLEARLIADTKPFDAAMTRSQGRMGTASKAMTIGAAAVVGGVGLMAKAAVNAAADYEAGLNTMQAVSGATGAEMKQISKLALALGNDIKLPGTSAKDAAEAMTELSKSGMSVEQTMKAVRPTLLLSAAAQVSNARAAEITSNALNAFGLDASRTSKIVDVLANTANSSSVEIEDVADAMKMAGAVFSGFQGPAVGAENALKDLATAVGILGNAGIKGSDAGTSLKQALLALASPAEKTKNLMRDLYLQTEGSAEAQRLYTVSIEGTTKKIRDEASAALEELQGATKGAGDIAYTASGQMRSLPEIVDQVTRATKGMTQEQRDYAISTIFGADATRAIIALMKTGTKGWDEMSEAVDRNGSAQDLANAKMKGLRGAQEALKSSLDTLAITFGLVLLPYVTAVTGALTSATGVVAQHQTAALIVTGVLLSLATAILAVKAALILYHGALLLVTAAKGLATAATTVYSARIVVATAATGAWTAAQWLLNAALTANPIGVVIVAVAALVAGIIVAYQQSEKFRDAIDAVWAAIKRLGTWIQSNWKTIVAIVASPVLFLAFKAISGSIDDITGGIKSLIGWVKDLIGWLGKIKFPSIDLPSLPGIPGIGGETGKVSPTSGVVQDLWDEIALGQGMGLTLTSGLRPGDPGDHGKGKAIDMAGPASTMATFSMGMMGRAGIKDVIYGGLNFWQDNGRRVNTWAGNEALRSDHYDHAHVSVFDKGGWLAPFSKTLAINRTPHWEPVGPPGRSGVTNNYFNFGNYVGDRRQLIATVITELDRRDRRNR